MKRENGTGVKEENGECVVAEPRRKASCEEPELEASVSETREFEAANIEAVEVAVEEVEAVHDHVPKDKDESVEFWVTEEGARIKEVRGLAQSGDEHPSMHVDELAVGVQHEAMANPTYAAGGRIGGSLARDAVVNPTYAAGGRIDGSHVDNPTYAAGGRIGGVHLALEQAALQIDDGIGLDRGLRADNSWIGAIGGPIAGAKTAAGGGKIGGGQTGGEEAAEEAKEKRNAERKR